MAQDLDLNDPDIWDDSVLIDSWNDALAEYKVSMVSRSRQAVG
jgi:hypothetical protein